MNGDLDIKAIFGVFISIILIIGVFIPVLSVLINTITQSNSKQQQIDGLNTKILVLEGDINTKQTQIAQLSAVIASMNNSIGDKEKIISNLTGQIADKEIILQNLTQELEYYKEKKYIQEINNHYYNISNYFEKIENRFFPIELQLSFISITLIAVINEIFGVRKLIIRSWKKITKKEEHYIHTEININNEVKK